MEVARTPYKLSVEKPVKRKHVKVDMQFSTRVRPADDVWKRQVLKAVKDSEGFTRVGRGVSLDSRKLMT